MNDAPDNLELRLRNRPRKPVSALLKTRVMETAVLASPVATWWDRVFFSRTWRLVAVGIVLALSAADHWSGAWRPVESPATDRPVPAEVDAVAAVGGEIGLSPEQMRRLAARVKFAPLTARQPWGDIASSLR